MIGYIKQTTAYQVLWILQHVALFTFWLPVNDLLNGLSIIRFVAMYKKRPSKMCSEICILQAVFTLVVKLFGVLSMAATWIARGRLDLCTSGFDCASSLFKNWIGQGCWTVLWFAARVWSKCPSYKRCDLNPMLFGLMIEALHRRSTFCRTPAGLKW